MNTREYVFRTRLFDTKRSSFPCVSSGDLEALLELHLLEARETVSKASFVVVSVRRTNHAPPVQVAGPRDPLPQFGDRNVSQRMPVGSMQTHMIVPFGLCAAYWAMLRLLR